jgi:hypothetical protein
LGHRPTNLVNTPNPRLPPAQVGLIAAFNFAALFFLRRNMPKYETLQPTLPPDGAAGSSGGAVSSTEAEAEVTARVAKQA